MFWERFVSLCNSKNEKPNRTAAKIGISSASVTKWKNGSIPNSDSLGKIAEYFCVSIDYLLGKSDQLIDDKTWDEHAKKFESSLNERRESDFKLSRQIYFDLDEADLWILADEIIPKIRMMNRAGLMKLAERADELFRLPEYMNQETRDLVEEEHRLWEEEMRKKEKPAD